MVPLYEEGHRVIVSFSAGKDSGVCLEVCLEAARIAGRLPVEVVLRDEEINLPGTYEYAERVASREDVELTWMVAHQPVINIFNRESPYWWVFDPQLSPDDWVRKPPENATYHKHLDITRMVTPELFPPTETGVIYSVVGLRVQESKGRLFGLHSSGGYLTKMNKYGIVLARPIYDWKEGDVWKAHKDFGWDYNSAYDAMIRGGVSPRQMRIAPPSQTSLSLDLLQFARKTWPAWFDRVTHRLPGIRTAADYGKRTVVPHRRKGETWQDTFQREVIDNAPEWIAERGEMARTKLLRAHKRHSTTPFPDVFACPQCSGETGSWKAMATYLYTGDPFSVKMTFLPYVEPERFRPGAGRWGGTPG